MSMEESFGILPVKKKGRKGWQVFLIQNRNNGHWGFPKGKANSGESRKDSAIRELKEETGLSIVEFLSDEPFLDHYEYIRGGNRIAKTVYYFPALVQGNIRLQSKEVHAGNWLPIDQAINKLTYQGAKQLCQKLEEILKNVD